MPSYHPDTLANRKLMWAIGACNPKQVRLALSEGANPQALYAYDGQADTPALTRAVQFQGEGAQEVVCILLEAGARMEEGPPSGAPPMVQSAISARAHGHLQAMIDYAGGTDAFLQRIPPPFRPDLVKHFRPEYLEHDSLALLFFKVWAAIPARDRPHFGVPHLPWVWGKIAFREKLAPNFLAQLESIAPRPTPERLGHRGWAVWMKMIAGSSATVVPFLFKEGLKQTPPEWWAKPLERAGKTEVPLNADTLLGLLAVHGRPMVANALVKAVQALPGGLSHPHAPDRVALLEAAAPSTAALRKVIGMVPAAKVKDDLSRLLLEAASQVSAPRHRQTRMRLLLEAGADPNVIDESGDTPLHMVCYHAHSHARHAKTTISMLLGAGASLEGPENHFGKTPLQVLEEENPALAAHFRAREMEARLPRSSTPSPRSRGRF